MRIVKYLLVLVFLSSFISVSHAQLARQWVARLSGNLKNGANGAVAEAIDDSGNVYVTGYVSRITSGLDIVTIKYSPDGQQMWVQYYPPTTVSGTDRPTAIAVDTAHNVYVTGTTTTGLPNTDFITMKINARGDSLLWVKTYNGPGNGEDHPVGIAVNDSLESFVTGWSMGSGTNYDFATVKYAPNGDTLWVRRYDGPANGVDSAMAMAVRGFTDLYVTGTSVDSGYDYLTVKYNAETGDTVWTARYNGVGFGNDIPRAILLRAANDVFITGSSQNALGDYDYLTLNYNASGVLQWDSRYDGGFDDQAYALANNGSSTIFVTGKSVVPGSFNDMTTIRINQSNGGGLHVDNYDGPGNGEDAGVAILGGSKPYALGASGGAGSGFDYALVQYSAADAENFVERYDGKFHADDVPAALVAGPNGEIVVSGRSVKDKGMEILTVKYVDPANIKYRTFTQADYLPKGVSLKSTVSIPNAGNVRDEAMLAAYPKIKKGFVGYPGGLVVGNARPDSASTFGWMRFDKGANVMGSLPDSGQARGFDIYAGKPFVGEKKNPKISKYNNHLVGELLAMRMNIGASDAEITPPRLGDLTYDDGDTSNHFNGMTLRQAATLADNYLTYWQRYPAIDWAHLDTVFTRSNRAFTGPFAWISKVPLVITGVNPVDSVTFLTPSNAPVANPLAFAPGAIDLLPDRIKLNQNYPNPFNPTTRISFALTDDAVVTLKIYNMLGQEVATLLDRQHVYSGSSEYQFNASSLASGVYFYRFVAENLDDEGTPVGSAFTQVKKMMFIK